MDSTVITSDIGRQTEVKNNLNYVYETFVCGTTLRKI